MTLLRVFELLVGNIQFPIRSIQRDHASKMPPEMGRRAHVTVNVDDFVVLKHDSLLLQLLDSYVSNVQRNHLRKVYRAKTPRAQRKISSYFSELRVLCVFALPCCLPSRSSRPSRFDWAHRPESIEGWLKSSHHKEHEAHEVWISRPPAPEPDG